MAILGRDMDGYMQSKRRKETWIDKSSRNKYGRYGEISLEFSKWKKNIGVKL